MCPGMEEAHCAIIGFPYIKCCQQIDVRFWVYDYCKLVLAGMEEMIVDYVRPTSIVYE